MWRPKKPVQRSRSQHCQQRGHSHKYWVPCVSLHRNSLKDQWRFQQKDSLWRPKHRCHHQMCISRRHHCQRRLYGARHNHFNLRWWSQLKISLWIPNQRVVQKWCQRRSTQRELRYHQCHRIRLQVHWRIQLQVSLWRHSYVIQTGLQQELNRRRRNATYSHK